MYLQHMKETAKVSDAFLQLTNHLVYKESKMTV